MKPFVIYQLPSRADLVSKAVAEDYALTGDESIINLKWVPMFEGAQILALELTLEEAVKLSEVLYLYGEDSIVLRSVMHDIVLTLARNLR